MLNTACVVGEEEKFRRPCGRLQTGWGGPELTAMLISLLIILGRTQRDDLFATLLAPVTARVNERFSNETVAGRPFVPVEVDACRQDPLVHQQPGGCMAQEPMTSLNDIGFLRALYTPSLTTDEDAPCGPAVTTHLEVKSGKMIAFGEPSVMGDYCWPAGVSNASRPSVNEALALAQATLTANGSTMPAWHTINMRMPLDPCVTEASYIFDAQTIHSAGNLAAWDSGLVVVGLASRRVCQTPITAVAHIPNGSVLPVCQQPDRTPKCWHAPRMVR